MMRNMVVFLLVLLTLVTGVVHTADAAVGKQVAFFPFYDDSGYKGPWKLWYEVPVMLGDMLGGADDYFSVVPMDSVMVNMPPTPHKSIFIRFFNLFRTVKEQPRILPEADMLAIARTLGADIAVTGVVRDYTFSRTGGGDPMLGGYKRYVAKAEIDQVRIVRVSDSKPLGTVGGKEDKVLGGLGLELFGKPREMDLEFYSLDSLDFGSRGWINTAWGQTTIEALNQVNKELRNVIARPDSAWFSKNKFKVLSAENGYAVINAGSADGIAPGDKYTVFAEGTETRVGKINILVVWSAHTARAEILDGRDEVRPGDTIMPEL